MMNSNANDNLNTMMAQLEKQAQLAEELASAARRHREVLEDGECEGLLSHLTARQHLVDEIERGQGVLDRHVSMLEEKLSAASPEQRGRIFNLIRAIQSNLAEVLAVDAADSGRIAARLTELIDSDEESAGGEGYVP